MSGEDTQRVQRVVEQELSPVAERLERDVKRAKFWVLGVGVVLLGAGGSGMAFVGKFETKEHVQKLLTEGQAKHAALDKEIADGLARIAVVEALQRDQGRQLERVEGKVDQVLLQLGGVKRTVKRLEKE